MSDASANSVESQISEVKASAHLMSMEPGLYCVFTAAESPVADVVTGLPCVRISGAPGQGAERIEVVGMNVPGWLGPDAATLVRVRGGMGKLLVTVYQSQGSAGEAPQIQVLRLGGEAAEGGAAPGAAKGAGQEAASQVAGRPAEPERMELMAHIWGKGDVGNHMGTWTGEPGSKRWIEGFGIAGLGPVPPRDIEYQAVLGRGWLSPWSEGGQYCGSRGMSLPILGLRVRLRGASASTHRVVLSASFVDGTQVGPLRDGGACEAPSLAALEAFEVKVEALGGPVVEAAGEEAVVAKPKAARASRKVGIAPGVAATPAAAEVPAVAAADAAPVAVRGASAGKKPSKRRG